MGIKALKAFELMGYYDVTLPATTADYIAPDNDISGLQEALNVGGVIYIPAGSYQLPVPTNPVNAEWNGSCFQVFDNTHIIINPLATFTFPTGLPVGDLYTVFANEGAVGGTLNNNIWIEGGNFSMPAPANDVGTQIAPYWYFFSSAGASNVTIDIDSLDYSCIQFNPQTSSTVNSTNSGNKVTSRCKLTNLVNPILWQYGQNGSMDADVSGAAIGAVDWAPNSENMSANARLWDCTFVQTAAPFSPPLAPSKGCFNLNGGSHFLASVGEIIGPGTSDAGNVSCVSTVGADDISFTFGSIHGGRHGLVIDDGNNIQVKGDFSGNNLDGIKANVSNGLTNLDLSGCTAHDNGVAGTAGATAGLSLNLVNASPAPPFTGTMAGGGFYNSATSDQTDSIYISDNIATGVNFLFEGVRCDNATPLAQAASPYNLLDGIRFSGCAGINPLSVTTPAVPAASTAVTNDTGTDVDVYITGGAAVAVSINGNATGLAGGTFFLGAGSTIDLGAYTTAPTWEWIGQ